MLEIYVCHLLSKAAPQYSLLDPLPRFSSVRVQRKLGLTFDCAFGIGTILLTEKGIKRLKIRNAFGDVLFCYGHWPQM